MSQPASFINLEKTIGVLFKDKNMLVRALTHRSSVRQSRSIGHNERLEFLGDAVLELVSTEYLFQFTDKSEGELTSWRSALVKGEHLATVANEIQLGSYIFMSRGEEASGGREKPSTLANAVEALIGALFLDQGYDKAKDFCDQFILNHLQKLLAEGKHQDFKSVFQEKSQELLGITPHYEVISEEGPDHDKEFTCAVFLQDERVAEGKGNSKQRAEQAAAKQGIQVKKWN
ncbi:ribonuclease III [Candidatus Peregrinibacteria bacterium]|jgi:ribonuclease III|nr:ribonuclease III [Candidatus Peregrinibacteria bacterium]MBT3598954.1 ribonuclease III [Candidatus Peregrinibacteria bacterium]MBT4367493.1 ribonuclease III [Candidatus Peregrinibacteria bacterium]MBT4585900.1 ribonuclease III [Candidatus Peregrinibacteria bacterium]MBT6731114.1 ribonuclease III [Candidatus Peregrinibacteria bacterium]